MIQFKHYFLWLTIAACLLLTACHSATDQQSSNQTATDQSTTMNKDDEKSKTAKPQVEASQAKSSKPLSDSADNAKDNPHEKMYEVPNRFPLSEKKPKTESTEKQEIDESIETKKDETKKEIDP
ncbi:hypothetical protein [Aliikangiella maris]|uniref:Uncharacterized protein n=2 Tax=Aliikangiella maris TaxID=3162458 RepID=A0ABV3MNM6_9GAMM